MARKMRPFQVVLQEHSIDLTTTDTTVAISMRPPSDPAYVAWTQFTATTQGTGAGSQTVAVVNAASASLIYSGNMTVTTAAATNTAVQGDGNGVAVAGNIALGVLPTAAGTVTDGPTGTLTVAWLT